MGKPNIVFVCADQLRYSAVACNGNRVVRTPNFDRLAREGVVFDQHFSCCPICAPYRGQLLTGRYPHKNGVIDNEYRLFDNQVTIADALKAEGYRTAFIGRRHLGFGPYPVEKRYGFDDVYGYHSSCDFYNISYWRNEEGPFRMDDYAPRVETRLVLDYIGAHRRSSPDQPFCVILSWGAPHYTHGTGAGAYGEYPQEYNIYDPAGIDVPDNVPVQMRDFARREIADYYGMVTSLDDCMGGIMEALEERGLAKNTILVFASDHGDHLNAHGFVKPDEAWAHYTLRDNKVTPYEEAIHLPFILRYPDRVKGNRRTDTMLGSVDLLPTLLGLCGVSVPDDVQGKDLSHAALGTPGEEPDSVYLQILGPGYPPKTVGMGMWRGVRTHRYTYARWHDRDGMRLLFDHQVDPLEMHNVVDDPDHAEAAEFLEKRLQQWMVDTEDPFDCGERLPVTNILDLGQGFVSSGWYPLAPEAYREAIAKYQRNFVPWEDARDGEEYRNAILGEGPHCSELNP